MALKDWIENSITQLPWATMLDRSAVELVKMQIRDVMTAAQRKEMANYLFEGVCKRCFECKVSCTCPPKVVRAEIDDGSKKGRR